MVNTSVPGIFLLQTTWQFFAGLIVWKLYILIRDKVFRNPIFSKLYCYFLFGIENVYHTCIARSNYWFLEWIRYKILSLNL